MLNFTMIKFSLFQLISLLYLSFVNGEDPFLCKFETNNDFCKWKYNTLRNSDKWVFRSINASQSPQPGPLEPVKGSAQFIQFNPLSNGIKADQLYTELYSQPHSETSTPFCFTFFYYMFGDDVGSLIFTVTHVDQFSNKNYQQFWKSNGSVSDKWHRQRVTIQPQQNQFNLNFQIYSSQESNIGSIALANFESSSGACKTLPNDYRVCDFESDECDWKIHNDPGMKWFIQNGLNKTKGGPINDHTYSTPSGHYLSTTEVRYDDEDGLQNQANFISPYYNTTQCLRFWYYKPKLRNELVVYTQDIKGRPGLKVWQNFDNLIADDWVLSEVTVFKKNPFSIIIQGQKINTFPSEVSIDDISMRSGPCAPVSCDFNVDLCGFTSFGWKQGYGRLSNYTLSQSKLVKDRTLSYGMYMYVDFTYKPQKYRTATLVSQAIYLSKQNCLRFLYYRTGIDIKMYIEVKGHKVSFGRVYSNNIYTTNSSDKINNWTLVEVDFKYLTDDIVNLVFEVTNSQIKSYFLAVDDIHLSNNSCKPQSVTPITTTPRPTVKHLASDLTCSFNSSLCQWDNTVDAKLNGTFVLSDPNRHKYGLPKYDHFGNNNGQYVYVYNDQNNKKLIKASIHTIELNENRASQYTDPVCVSFWFYMRTDGYANLTFSRAHIYGEKLWAKEENEITKSGSFGEKWHYVEVDLEENDHNCSVYLNVTLESGVIAISDLQLYRDKCKAKEKGSMLFNNFESGLSDYLIQYRYRSQFFNLFNGKNLSTQINDHTLDTKDGHMIAYDLGSPKLPNNSRTQYALLESYSVKGVDSCVTFWYYIRGEQTLNVFVKREQVHWYTNGDFYYRVKGEQGPFWHAAQFDVEPDDLSFKLMFEINGTKHDKGVIAIDDVIIDVGKKCPIERRCDFENDKCLWESVSPNWIKTEAAKEDGFQNVKSLLNTQFVWNRHSGIHDGNRLWPVRDHTIKTAEGSYLVLSADPPRKNGDRAVLMSQRYELTPNTTTLCFSMAYILQNGSKIELYQSEKYNNYKTLNIITVPNTEWKVIKININRQEMNSTNIWLYIVGIVGPNPSAFAAIDDISVDLNKCYVDETSFNCNDDGSEKIPKTKVCDFREDCNDGRDESNCGSCLFSKTFCGYESVGSKSTSFNWHPINASNGYITAKQDLQIDKRINADLLSPLINYASASCRISFQYLFVGNKQSIRLSVFAKIANQEEVELWDSLALVNKSMKGYFSESEAFVGVKRSPFRIIFRAFSTGDKADYIAIKNVKFLDCEPISPAIECDISANQSFKCLNSGCIDKSLVCDHTDDCGDGSDENKCQTYIERCNFEDGFCGWRSDKLSKDVNQDWIRQKDNRDLSVGPTRDHSKGVSSGTYLIMKYLKTDSKPNGLIGRLEGPVFRPNPDCKMRFHYDIEGDGFMSLSINIRLNQSLNYKTVWNTNQVMNKFWFNRAEIQFDKQVESFQVFILGSIKVNPNRTSSVDPFIALDDISFTPECIRSNSTIEIPISTTTKTTSYTTVVYHSTGPTHIISNNDKPIKSGNAPLIVGIVFAVIVIFGIGIALYYFRYKFIRKQANSDTVHYRTDRVDSVIIRPQIKRTNL